MTKLARVCDSIVARIESGALREGDRLPSESQLAAGFRVSVGTVQKALSRLAHSGLISREHGRGTFVSGSRIGAADVNYLRFRDAEGRDLPHYIRVTSVRRLMRKGPWSEFLGAQAGHIRIERLINVGGKVEIYSEFWLRETEFRRLNGVDHGALAKNLRVMLGQQLSLPTLRVDQWIRFDRLPQPVLRKLGLRDQPGFIMEMRGYTLRDQPLFYHKVSAGPFSHNLVIVR
ncbi:MAG: GntR family transcriptional regulator [Betaproteobacteria bacterium]|nr:MAG: GntR family transcriptional regulator [Betaproteobacteria bacterium]